MAPPNIDMSLDELIKSSAARRRPKPTPSSAPGPLRRLPLRHHSTATAAPYTIFPPQARQVLQPNFVPLPEMMAMENNGGAEAESETKLYISNLDHGVSNGDIKLLFSEEGVLKRYSIHYDKSGRSKGTAEVVFTRKSDALAAMKKYNNMKLDGKPLHIELVGTSLLGPVPSIPPFQNSILGRPNHVLVSGEGRREARRFPNGIPRAPLPRGNEEKFRNGRVSFRDLDNDLDRYHRHPRGHGGTKGNTGKVSLKDLDDDLERYRSEAMKTSEENRN